PNKAQAAKKLRGSGRRFGIGVASTQDRPDLPRTRLAVGPAVLWNRRSRNEEPRLPVCGVYFVYRGCGWAVWWRDNEFSTASPGDVRQSATRFSDCYVGGAQPDRELDNHVCSRRKAAVGSHAGSSGCATWRFGTRSEKRACRR